MATQVRQRGDRPTDEVMTSVRESVVVLRVAAGPFTRACYAELIALVPSILQTAQDHGHAVAEEFTTHVLWAAASDEPADALAARLRRVGAGLYRQGFPVDGYQGAAHAVLRAARDSYPQDWDSTLSSAWVAYLSWAGDQLAQGAAIARSDGVAAPSAAGLTATPTSLTGIFEALRTGPFAGNAKALDLVATRIALRTGADIRFPRMDQQGDAALVATVLGALTRMGYDVGTPDLADAGDPAPPAAADAGGLVAAHLATVTPVAPMSAVAPGSAGTAVRRARWWNRRQRPGAGAAPATGSLPLPVQASALGAAPGQAPATAPVAAPATAPGGLPLGEGYARRGTFDAFVRLGDAPVPTADAQGSPTLTDVLARLRSGPFLGSEWALDGVLTRVALRTGADLRDPRPDQVADPVVVRDVLAVLARMGYGDDAGGVTERPRWWSRQRRRDRIA